MQINAMNKLNEFLDAFHKDERFVNLNKLEKDVVNNSVVKELSEKFKKDEEKYNEYLEHYGENSLFTKEAKSELLRSKKELDSNPLVSTYNDAFVRYNDLMRQIDLILFSDFKENTLCKNCHD